MLTEAGCRARQQRLRELLTSIDADVAAITDPHEIYYFTGVLLPIQPLPFPGLFWLDGQGRSLLVAPKDNLGGYVAERLEYDAKEGSTGNPDNGRRVNVRIEQRLHGTRMSTIAYQAETMPKAIPEK